MVSPGDVADLDRIAGIFDEPFADASALPTLRPGSAKIVPK